MEPELICFQSNQSAPWRALLTCGSCRRCRRCVQEAGIAKSRPQQLRQRFANSNHLLRKLEHKEARRPRLGSNEFGSSFDERVPASAIDRVSGVRAILLALFVSAWGYVCCLSQHEDWVDGKVGGRRVRGRGRGLRVEWSREDEGRV
eukprot:1996019-Rhodomonas_salina.1